MVNLMLESEHTIQKRIQLGVSQHHSKIFRVNVGKGFLITYNQIKGKMPNGDYIVRGPLNYFNAGIPKGHPDLYGFREVDGKIFYIEVKNQKGKPSEDQIRFHRMLASHNIIHGIARSVDDARMIVEGGLVGYGFND